MLLVKQQFKRLGSLSQLDWVWDLECNFQGGSPMLRKISQTLLYAPMLILMAHANTLAPIPRETVMGHRDANNGFSWDFNYDIEFTGEQLNIRTALQFTLGFGVTQGQLDSLKSTWEQGIEELWSNKYGVLMDNTFLFPIVFDVTYKGPVFNYTINLGLGRTMDMLDWGTQAALGESDGN